jgi:predicted phosphodiesterase
MSDAHLSLMHDSEKRLGAFIAEMQKIYPDFIIELGDFFPPDPKFSKFYEIWNEFEGEKFHVIGNHETDGGFSLEQVLQSRLMESPYYSFQKNGFHFIVLDGNNKKSPDTKPYFRFIGQDQINWLKEDLSNSEYPIVVFSHQELFCPEGEEDMGIENYREIQELFESHNLKRPATKIIASFNGHTHFDFVENINGIWYIQINSMSYNWLGGDYAHNRFSEQIDQDYPFIKYTAPFEDPLFAHVEISKEGYIKITGRESEWIKPDPWELGYPESFKRFMRPQITDRFLEF